MADKSSSWRLSWASAFRLHGGRFNGSFGVGAPSASFSIVATKSVQCSGSVQRRISAQNSGSPTAQHSKPFKHWQRMCAEFQETFHGTLHDKRETFQNNVKHIKHSKYYLFLLHKFTEIL
jgi:hypothetical protein